MRTRKRFTDLVEQYVKLLKRSRVAPDYIISTNAALLDFLVYAKREGLSLETARLPDSIDDTIAAYAEHMKA